MIDFSPKQKQVWRNSFETPHRWNISYGATRSGKTYLDYFKIPYRIRNAGEQGLILLLGNTKSTIERNILDPMRQLWTSALVGRISSNNKIRLFGREAYAIGADNLGQVSKLQGSGLAYCYGDEIQTWNEDVFQMLKSRLDKPTSCFDGTTNPDSPNHWFKKFLDSDADIYQMQFCIDDNPFNSKSFVDALKKEYEGTVYYDRFILGLWKAAEGVCYPLFCDKSNRYIKQALNDEDIWFCTIGLDWGGHKSGNAFVCTGFSKSFDKVVVLDEHYDKGIKSPDEIYNNFIKFVNKNKAKYRVVEIYADSAEQTLIAGLKVALIKAGIMIDVKNSIKNEINDRIRFTNALFGSDKIKILPHCEHIINALQAAIWDKKSLKDERVDDGKTANIDILDSFEYSFEKYMKSVQTAVLYK